MSMPCSWSSARRPARTIGLLVVGVAVWLTGFAVEASATVRVNQGMFGISLGQSETHVRHKLGRPDGISHDRKHHETDWYYGRKDLFLTFTGKKQRLDSMITGNPRERTANGVGVGSTEAQVTTGVRHASCEADPPGRGRVCMVESPHAFTIFGLDNGKTLGHIFIASG
jgi:hypothetical protein